MRELATGRLADLLDVVARSELVLAHDNPVGTRQGRWQPELFARADRVDELVVDAHRQQSTLELEVARLEKRRVAAQIGASLKSQAAGKAERLLRVCLAEAPLDPSEETLDEIIALADQAMYSSKTSGRNCVTYVSFRGPVAEAAASRRSPVQWAASR